VTNVADLHRATQSVVKARKRAAALVALLRNAIYMRSWLSYHWRNGVKWYALPGNEHGKTKRHLLTWRIGSLGSHLNTRTLT